MFQLIQLPFQDLTLPPFQDNTRQVHTLDHSDTKFCKFPGKGSRLDIINKGDFYHAGQFSIRAP